MSRDPSVPCCRCKRRTPFSETTWDEHYGDVCHDCACVMDFEHDAVQLACDEDDE